MNWRNILNGLAIGFPVGIVIIDYFGYVARVEGVSMQPVLNPISEANTKDYVLLNKWSIRKFDIRHGDIISLISPRDANQKIIKRVICLEGETIKTVNKGFIKIPQGHCWVEGDNHAYSMDSNFFGPVAVGLITAKATIIVWPIHRWQRLESQLLIDTSQNVSMTKI